MHKNHHHIQVNTFIKSFFSGSTEKELHRTLDMFWIKYSNLNHKNDLFDSHEFIWNSKDTRDGASSINIDNKPQIYFLHLYFLMNLCVYNVFLVLAIFSANNPEEILGTSKFNHPLFWKINHFSQNPFFYVMSENKFIMLPSRINPLDMKNQGF